MDEQVIYLTGIPEEHRSAAAELYDAAFGEKFSLAIKDAEARKKLLAACFNLDHALCAVGNGKLLGIAGYNSVDGSLTGGITYQSLVSELGTVKGIRAALVFSIYDRKREKDELLMDGIAVHENARGQGVGTRLLKELKTLARTRRYRQIRLDVIDGNAGAKKLYQRQGFEQTKHESFPYLKWLFGFGGISTMIFRVVPV